MVSAARIRLICRDLSLAWLDGIPLVFNFPLTAAPEPAAIEVRLSDGSVVR